MSLILHPAQVEPQALNGALHAIHSAFKGQGINDESLVGLTAHYDPDTEKSIIVWEEGCYEWPFDYAEKISSVLTPMGLWAEPCNHWSIALYWL